MLPKIHPKWWQLYLTFPLLIVLFMLDGQLKISVRGHQAVQIGILLLFYGLIELWLNANASALSKMDDTQDHGTFTVIQIIPNHIPDEDKDIPPMFDLPASEIKGLLSDTFEMDNTDLVAFSIDDISQESKKD